MKEYLSFLEKKKEQSYNTGFNPKGLNKNLFPFQKHILEKALNSGKYAIFADCGMGKTIMQLSWADEVVRHTGGNVLILAPLAVSGQTIEEGRRFGIDVCNYGENGKIQITNYEQLSNIDERLFSGIVLDESSIIKNFNGKTKELLFDKFGSSKFYKLACTATPSPNDPMELGNHSEFLNVMTRNEVLAMYFVHDGGNTSKWRLKGHAKDSFFSFVSSWATMISKPSDIGFDDKGYNLPSLNFLEKTVITDKRENGQLFNDTAVSATEFNKELRLTKVKRINEVVDIVNESDEQFIIWVKQNEEADLVCKLIPDAVNVKGSDKAEYKKDKLLGFAKNEFRVLVTKTKIAQFGLNYQNCNNQVFASLDFSFEGLYQAIRRSYRFGQKNDVNIYIITTDTMQNVVQSIKNKERQFNEMKEMMKDSIKDMNVSVSGIECKDSMNENYHLMRGDCVQRIKEIESDSVGLSVFSPPFAELYTYSSHIEDMGNSKDYKEFLTQFGFLVKELYRVVKSGRNVAVHCMDLPIQKGKEGFIGLRDFSGMILDAFKAEGFIYHSRVTIWKDPVVEMQRTKALGLLHKQVKKDSTMSRVGIPDYVLIFRKDGERNDPVTNTDLPVDLWQKYASPVWMDINYSNTMNLKGARDEKDEKHICPLQLDTIERIIHLYSNEGDTIFTPFMGIGSEVYQSLIMDRKAIGIELKESYYNLAVKNAMSAERSKMQVSLF